MNPLSPVWTIAKASYKEQIRNRILVAVLLMAVLVTASSFFLGSVSFDQTSRVIQNVGLGAIHLFAVLITLFVTATSMQHDAERRVLYLLFPKPISRGQYVVGKFVGMALLGATILAILGGMFAAGTFFVDKALLPITGISLLYSWLEVSLIAAVSLMFATFANQLNAALYATALLFIGHSTSFVRDYLAAINAPAFTQRISDAAYFLLPNLEKFDVRRNLLYSIPIPASHPWTSLLYWAVLTSLVLYLAILVTRKQEY